MPRVFISYSSKDSALKDQINAALKESGFSTYVDVEDIRPAQYLPKKIKNAIDKSDALIAIITENSLPSNWVQNEIGYADGRVPIVPLVVGAVKPGGILTGREYVPWNTVEPLDFANIIKRARSEFVPSEAPTICDEGPYEIESGEYTLIELKVSKGDKIRGRIEEVDGLDFDWYIVDENNLVDFKNGEGFDYEDGGEGLAAYTLRWTVKKKGPWYLVLEVPRRQIARSVGVYLRKQ